MRMAWLAGLVLVVAGAHPVQADEWSRRYPVEGRPELRVSTDDGNVTVEAAPGPEIEARVTTEGWRIGPGDVSIRDSQSGNRVEIEVRRPQGNGFSMRHRSISVVVSVPIPADLEIRTGDGSIEVKQLSGNLALATGDGSITADGVDGDLHLHTGDGPIHATGLMGRLEADTGDGHMNVRGRFDVIDLHTGDGDVEAVAESGSRVESAWSIRSGDGNVTLRLPAGLGAELDAHTGDGRIDLEHPVSVSGKISESAVRGRIGTGGPPLRIHTGNGSIHLVGL